MRTNALCASSAKTFDAPETPGSRSFFSEIIRVGVGRQVYSRRGFFVVSRRLNMRLWDLRMENRPVATFDVHEHLRAKLCDLYESDAIFDKFQCCPGGDGAVVATGSYAFSAFDVATGASDAFEVTKDPQRFRARAAVLENGKGFRKRSPRTAFAAGSARARRVCQEARRRARSFPAAGSARSAAPSQPEFNTKILHMAHRHPADARRGVRGVQLAVCFRPPETYHTRDTRTIRRYRSFFKWGHDESSALSIAALW